MKQVFINIARMIKERPRRRIRKRLLIFSFCLVGALLIWLLNTLGRTYRFSINTPVVFVNAPQGKAIVTNERKEVKLMIEGTGWHFLRSKISMFDEPIRIDLRNSSGKNTVNLEKQLPRLNEQIPVKVKIISIEPSTLTYEFEKKASKKIPVRLMANITFDHSYYYNGPVHLKPDSIVISGPSQVIGRINEWKTELVTFSNLSFSVQSRVSLLDNNYLNIELPVKKILVTIPVEKYTEGQVTVPIRLKSLLESGSVELLPSACSVHYQVSLSKYDKVKSKDFSIIAEVDPFNKEKLNLSIINSPDYILYPRVSPDQIDYIIKR